MKIASERWGTVDGHSVELFTLSNDDRMTVGITNYGGVVQSIWVPDRAEEVVNVVLGFPGLSDYVANFTDPPPGGSGATYFGAIVGRCANRIANHSFALDGVTYELPGNN